MSLTIYKSSAGSGKTYTLSREYLKLALRAPDYYKKILAVTFTNRAAEEMKERVLLFLHEMSIGSHDLVNELWEALKISEEEVVLKAKEVLGHLLHHYSFFNITTIDTFFHRVVRSFSREIGLQGAFQIELDNDKVMERIIDSLMEEVDTDKVLRKWLIDFSMDRLTSGKGYEFRSEIKGLGRQLFSEDFKKLPQTQFFREDGKDQIKKVQHQLYQLIRTFEQKLQEIGKSFFDTLQQNGLAPDELKGGSRSPIAGFFTKLVNRNYKDLINKTVEKCVNDAGEWATKTSGKKEVIFQLAEEKLLPLMQDAVVTYTNDEKKYFTAQVILKHLYTLGLLTDLSTRLQEYRVEEEAVMISDLPDFLSQIIRDSDAPFIYEKVGSRYAHFLIDEFQDTSVFQWNNFKPLLNESLANGNENLLVGDAKQSIYAFRGGDPSLLLRGVQEELSEVEEEVLGFNYRSSVNIVAFNNQLFSQLPALLCELAAGQLTEEGKGQIVSAYETVTQKVPAGKTDKGAVEVQFLTSEKGEDWKTLAVQETIQLVEKLQKEGHSLNEMAMLVRTNGEARFLVNQFINYKNSDQADPTLSYEVISADGMLLSSSPVVQLLLGALSYLQNPKNKVVESELVFKYLELSGKVSVSHEELSGLKDQKLPEGFNKYKEHLLHLPIYELIEVLIRLFGLEKRASEYAYLQAFQDAVLEFTKNNRSDVTSFLNWWEEKNRPDRKPSVQLTGALNAIEIITVHKAKGLQYPIVIVPFCNFDLDSRWHLSWYKSPESTPFDAFDTVPVEYSSSLQKTYMETAYQDEVAKWYLEHLNMLYVTFTRAERALFAFCEMPSPKSRSNHSDVSKLLKSYFEKEKPDGWSNDAFKVGELPAPKSVEKKGTVTLSSYPSYKWSNRLAIRRMGSSYFDPDQEQKRKEGILLHQILSEVKTYYEVEEVLDRYEKGMQITVEDKGYFSSIFSRLWQNEQIKSWFSPDVKIKTEVVVLPKDGEFKRMDRVLINEKLATVIDFKSGRPKKEDKVQVEAYMQLLSEMGYDTEGFLLYLKSATVEEV
ncbi:MAG: UvrD-helicase domain-containing protein [Bacteroidota bacterium]